ncbi:type I-E CRISPR-associated protein Cse2/CasB [Ectothiorhodospira shaposhnikovii]|uniref:type I-E CRISPR-associated protein Cse2/CasB n=1 Tax=Ectothiorhodospira shaposhnikovii TaxID=1054 RepID=UPI0039A21D22
MTQHDQAEQTDFFIPLVDAYQRLGTGGQADLRRVKNLDAVADLPAYYRWLGHRKPTSGLQRFAFLLPYMGNHLLGLSPGRALRKARINEMRIFQVLRSQSPRDIEQLRRLFQQARSPDMDANMLGRSLCYWNQFDKQKLLRDFLITEIDLPSNTSQTADLPNDQG